MTRRRIATVRDVAEAQLCSGCGVCASVAPAAVEMVDTLADGRRPVVVDPTDSEAMRAAVAACPGIALEHAESPPDAIDELRAAWGPVLELWEGHASDPEIRHAGSSGGAATALALHALANGFSGVVHIAARADAPLFNATVFSTTRAELLAATGSRYAPASPGDGLGLIPADGAPAVFVGKPCDVAGFTRAARVRPDLGDRVGLTIAMFCAGTPSLEGTLEMLTRMGVPDDAAIRSVRYRGNGWPGDAIVEFVGADGVARTRRLTYDESWGDVLRKHRPWRCHVCPDHTGEFADIAVGDPWYEPPDGSDPGRSLVLARTERGRRFLDAARASGALELTPAAAWKLPESQRNLLVTRGAVWARVAVSGMLGAATPRYRGLPTFRFWWRELSRRDKVQSLAGTVRRTQRRKLRRPRAVVAVEPTSRFRVSRRS